MFELGKRLKLLRTNKKLTQLNMANFLNITHRHYQDIEYGKVNIPISMSILLADFYNVSLDYLVGRSDDDSSFNTSLNYQTISAKMPINPETKK